ncbi:hypothetical protein [Dactylosporangium sp. CA-233914]|uniref:hypothetical protein n=1 Tax=Dactylosporangium sp. CA-233914 TaxID=3239934 RepID=UPI003D90EB8D
MKIAKGVLAAFVAVTSLALVAACSGKDKPGAGASAGAPAGAASPAPAKSLGATERLSAAASKTGGGTYTYKTISNDITIDGAADPAGPTSVGKLVVAVESTKVTFETLFTSGNYLVRITGLPLPGLDGKKWLKVDPSKVKNSDMISAADVKDPTGLSVLPTLVTQATTTDGRSFTGTLDVTKESFALVDKDALKGLGDLAKAVPFTATVDDKGYLTSVKVSVPAYSGTKADNVTITYTGFGAPVLAPTPAASEMIDAPESAYSLLNGA